MNLEVRQREIKGMCEVKPELWGDKGVCLMNSLSPKKTTIADHI